MAIYEYLTVGVYIGIEQQKLSWINILADASFIYCDTKNEFFSRKNVMGSIHFTQTVKTYSCFLSVSAADCTTKW